MIPGNSSLLGVMLATEAAPSMPQDSTVLKQLQNVREILNVMATRGNSGVNLIDLAFVRNLVEQGWIAASRYIFGCLLTALLISFGAPLWNDLAGVFGVLKRGEPLATQQPRNGGENA